MHKAISTQWDKSRIKVATRLRFARTRIASILGPLINIVASVTAINWTRPLAQAISFERNDYKVKCAVLSGRIFADKHHMQCLNWKKIELIAVVNDRQISKLNIDINYARCKQRGARDVLNQPRNYFAYVVFRLVLQECVYPSIPQDKIFFYLQVAYWAD